MGSQPFPDGAYMPDGSGTPNYFLSYQMWQNGVMTPIKNFPGTPGDALATLRNIDGRIMVFGIQGECPGQNVNGVYFDNANPPNNPATSTPPTPTTVYIQNCNNQYTQTSNNYILDYDANNVLSASNDIVSSGTTVYFNAGNEVHLQGTFIAQQGCTFFAIPNDPTLLCSNSGYFRKPVKHSSPVNQLSTDTHIKVLADSLGILVKQSVTRGQFYVGLNKIDSTELNQQALVTVYNLLGQTLYQNYMMVTPNNTLPINMTNTARGEYIVIIRTKDRTLHGKVILQ